MSGIVNRVRLTQGVLSFVELRPPSEGAPSHRRLRIYALDPALPRSAGGIVSVPVLYEPLLVVSNADGKALSGAVLCCDASDDAPPPLDDSTCALSEGLAPRTGSLSFSCQMVYAVAMQVYELFRIALGRSPRIPFKEMLLVENSESAKCAALKLRPDMETDEAAAPGEPFANACYDSENGEIRFGAFDAPDSLGAGSKFRVQTALSADIVAHEMVHALVDGERPMLIATNAETVGLHEGFADLIALFLHFIHRDYLADAIERKGGDLDDALLLGLAREFGRSLDARTDALRTVLVEDRDVDSPPPAGNMFNILLEPHALGAVLTAAVFGAFRTVYRRKSGLLRKLSPEEMSRAKAELFAERVQELAQDFLSLLIRAIDYLPPVHATFSDFLRALLTADFELVSEDKWGYRDAIADSFRRFGIPFHGLSSYSPDSVRWMPFGAPPGAGGSKRLTVPVRNENESTQAFNVRLAGAVTQWLTDLANEDPGGDLWRNLGIRMSPPPNRQAEPWVVVVGVAFARRMTRGVGMVEELIVQLVQSDDSNRNHTLDGGTTLIFDVYGKLKYAIAVPVCEIAGPAPEKRSLVRFNRGGILLAAAACSVPASEIQRQFARGIGAPYAKAFSASALAERARIAKKAMFALKHHHFEHWAEPRD